MIRLLQLLIWGHVHQWDEPADKGTRWSGEGGKLPIGHWMDCRCKTCGAWKRFKI